MFAPIADQAVRSVHRPVVAAKVIDVDGRDEPFAAVVVSGHHAPEGHAGLLVALE